MVDFTYCPKCGDVMFPIQVLTEKTYQLFFQHYKSFFMIYAEVESDICCWWLSEKEVYDAL